MDQINNREFFLDMMQIIRNRCTREEYILVSKMIENLYYQKTFGYLSGYDPDFFGDIQNILALPRKKISVMLKPKQNSNVIKFKPRSRDK